MFHYTKPGMICPVVRYAPKPAMMPSMASLPFNFSATIFSLSIVFVLFVIIQKWM